MKANRSGFASVVAMIGLMAIFVAAGAVTYNLKEKNSISPEKEKSVLAKPKVNMYGKDVPDEDVSFEINENNPNQVSISIEMPNPNKSVDNNPGCFVIENDIVYPTLKIPTIEITRLQRFLFQNKYSEHEPTGFYGPISRDAIHTFQSKHGLSISDDVNLETRNKIKEESCEINGDQKYSEKMVLTSPKNNEILYKKHWVFLTWIPGYIASPNETKKTRYDISVIDSNGVETALFKNISRLGYYWNVGTTKADFINPVLSDGLYKLKVCVTGKTDCLIGENEFIVTSQKPSIMACTKIPCFYDGQASVINDINTVDFPPEQTSAKYPYEFWTDGGIPITLVLSTTNVRNTDLHVMVDNKIVYFIENREQFKSNIDEIELGVLSEGVHRIQIYSTQQSYLPMDWFELVPTIARKKHLDN